MAWGTGRRKWVACLGHVLHDGLESKPRGSSQGLQVRPPPTPALGAAHLSQSPPLPPPPASRAAALPVCLQDWTFLTVLVDGTLTEPIQSQVTSLLSNVQTVLTSTTNFFSFLQGTRILRTRSRPWAGGGAGDGGVAGQSLCNASDSMEHRDGSLWASGPWGTAPRRQSPPCWRRLPGFGDPRRLAVAGSPGPNANRSLNQ